ncbi:hypothetical protein G6F52_011829 [Rhizopus delemar]|uniref:Uncharacterized protein n=1 Tax=Rhizopus oryzae TaxID=64495 RepID=A0A9P6XP91_RHIOR|nr:hypothetical protein G6F52_011829 [Rhizopus delemar]KAG1529535.1 hypothetical protein G6F51_014117 [Rhizopus arrhizus]KAG1534230.1 hypothetical protein G6F51_012211 [Rhizopus arrhizus]KAG1534233.1 hypothetical protein G6F51_012214 [Rhizopus arrhizus]KAG1534957.1 hypothetical protein G6F51_011798 [Rhizopus arrhizus]
MGTWINVKLEGAVGEENCRTMAAKLCLGLEFGSLDTLVVGGAASLLGERGRLEEEGVESEGGLEFAVGVGSEDTCFRKEAFSCCNWCILALAIASSFCNR